MRQLMAWYLTLGTTNNDGVTVFGYSFGHPLLQASRSPSSLQAYREHGTSRVSHPNR